MTEQKTEFVRLLAEYLVANEGTKSIELQMGKPHAKFWAKMRDASPIRGYSSVEEAEKILTEWLWPR